MKGPYRGVMGVIGVTGAGQTLGGGKETEEGEEMAGETKNEQGQIGRLSHQYKLEG